MSKLPKELHEAAARLPTIFSLREELRLIREIRAKKPMSDAELAVFEASQDFEALLVQSAREMGVAKSLQDAATCDLSGEDQKDQRLSVVLTPPP